MLQNTTFPGLFSSVVERLPRKQKVAGSIPGAFKEKFVIDCWGSLWFCNLRIFFGASILESVFRYACIE
ncbi:hypothetical protein AYI70_g12387 [Smittium culicis]|uniref:Uncharacterized protein n=1 Tax=Smittium culicis TaxID=133412 RepID=A0A1R1WXS6_9FUNG|nr:hypothetical protein AYI70_g12387 [Smittium culicis]